MLPVNLGDFATGGGMLNPLTGEFNPAGLGSPVSSDKFGAPAQNSNPYGFTAPTGPSTSALVPYYNKATGETWNAPGGGYTPPSADWFQGSPGNSQITPMPGFAPGSGLDPVKSNKMPATLAEWQAQQGPIMTADVKPWAGTVDASGTWRANTPEQAAASYAKFAAESNNTTPIGITQPPSGGSGLGGLVAPTQPGGNNYTPLPVGNIGPGNTSAGMAPSFLPQAEQDRLNALNLQNMNPQLRAPVSSQQPDPGPFAPAGRAPTDGIIKETPIGANNPNTGLPWGTIATPQNSTVNPMTGRPWETAAPGRAPTGGIVQDTFPMGGNQNVGILSPAIGQQPRPTTGGLSPTTGTAPNVGILSPAIGQQPRPTTGGLGSLATPQQPVVNRPVTPPVNAGGLNSLARPQPRPFVRNQIAPRAGSLPSLRFNPINRSLPVPFTRPAFRR
jgi:hypothetical protein